MKLAKPVTSSSEAAVKIVRQLRAAHPALGPTGVDDVFRHTSAALTPQVNAFLDHLAELPLAMWLETGRALATDHLALHVRRRARDALEMVMRSHALGFAGWSLRDAVETVVFLKTSEMREWTSAERRHFASAHGAAEAAALAVLAHDYLDGDDFAALMAPFAQFVGGIGE